MNYDMHVEKQSKISNNDVLPDRSKLKYDFMTSLMNITVAKIISYLWMNQNTQQKIVNLFRSGVIQEKRDFSEEWPQVENTVLTKVSSFSLPKLITKKLTSIVPLLGKDICNWIKYHDEYIFCTRKYSKYSAVDYVDNIKWTARGKIDYQQTAQNILAKKDNGLSDDHKYKLACTYCLEDEIRIIATKVVSQHYLNSIYMDEHPMVYFWTAYITGDNSKLHNPRYDWPYNKRKTDIGINEHILHILLKSSIGKSSFNTIPIKYIWDKLSEEEKIKNVSPLIAHLRSQDLRYSLLSDIDYEQQQQVFKDRSGNILEDMLNDWPWEGYFLPTALHILDIISPTAYLYIIKKIIDRMNKNSQDEHVYDQCKFIFKELWQNSSKQLKDFVFQYEKGKTLETLIISSLSWEKEIDIIRLIFNDLNTQQKKDIILKSNGIKKCAEYISNHKWDLLNRFIEYTLFSEEDINQLKQKIIKENGRGIAVKLIEQGDWDKVEDFMNWAFKSEEEIKQFKQRLGYSKICNDILKSIVTNNEANFIELENYFKWCASNDHEMINKFKIEIPEVYFGEVISTLIEKDKYELLEKMLNWCFLNDQEQIEKFKTSMHQDDDVKSLAIALITNDDSFKSLDKFIDWCFINKQEIPEFKKWLICPQKDSDDICSYLLREYHFELADKLINKFLTPEEINTLKATLMLSNNIEHIFDYYLGEEMQNELKLLIKWFNPSKETVAEFKKLFSEEDCPENFYQLLDEIVQNQTNPVSNNIEEAGENFQSTLEIQDALDISTIGKGDIDNSDIM